MYSKVLEELSSINNFKTGFPSLLNSLKSKEVSRWSKYGEPMPLTQSNREEIERLEANEEVLCYGVMEYSVSIPDSDETVRMTSYLLFFLDNFDGDYNVFETDEGSNLYYAMTKTVNHDWNLNDWGDIVIKPGPYGGPVRHLGGDE